MKLDQCYDQMDQWTASHTPFLAIIDFEQQAPLLYRLADLNGKETPIYYEFPKLNNSAVFSHDKVSEDILVTPVKYTRAYEDYTTRFTHAIELMQKEKVDVINLTRETLLEVEGSLKGIYAAANSKYKLLVNNKFVCCSPEIFVRIGEDNVIRTYPMKGTIDANIPDAKNIVLNSEKEQQEHRATVDVLIEEFSEVAESVEVANYRYLDRLTTTDRDLYQVSSEVVGQLKDEYRGKYGSLLKRMLPAGSIVGAPKDRAYQIIRSVEGYKRGYYTGICALYDGLEFDSCVLIRFIEEAEDGKFFYKSGGGITSDSVCDLEFEETLNKIYVPLD